MHGPTLVREIARVVGVVISRVTRQVGIVIQCTLVDGQELMTGHVGVVRALAARTVVNGILRSVCIVASLVVSLGPEVEGTMLFQLLQTLIEEKLVLEQVEIMDL